MKKKKKKGSKVLKHLKKIGFTNRLAIYMLLFLFFGLLGGFYLGIKSIQYEYMGSLLCWTVVFTPIGTATSVAISKVVDKSKAENTVGGIKFETAMVDIENNSTTNSAETILDSPMDSIYENDVNSPQI